MSAWMYLQNVVILEVKQWPNYLTLWPTRPALRNSVQYKLHFAADRKQLVTSYPARLWGPMVHDKRVKSRDPHSSHS